MKKSFLIIILASSYIFDQFITTFLNGFLFYYSCSLLFVFCFLSFHFSFTNKILLWLVVSYLLGCNYSNYFPISFICLLAILLIQAIYCRLFSMSSFEWICLLIINFIAYYGIEFFLLKYIYKYKLSLSQTIIYEFMNSFLLNIFIAIVTYYMYVFIENKLYKQQINK